MSLKARYKSSAALREGGVWFDVTTNSDGSKCRVRLRRHGRGNKFWTAAYRANTSGIDTDAISIEEDEAITAKVFVEGCVVEWEHVQPEDDGKDLPFTIENAIALLIHPDWVELLKDWQNKANSLEPFQNPEEDAKN